MANILFSPTKAGTVNCAPAGTSASVALASAKAGVSLRIKNCGTVRVFYELGGSAVAAVAATSVPLDPGETEMVRLESGDTHIAGITASGTGSLYATTGRGE